MPHHRDTARDPLPQLNPLFGGTDKKPRVLERDAMILGRARGCDIVLEATEISAVHCVFYRAPVGVRVRDCASRTGTRVNGNPVRNVQLCDGDILQVGPFSFEVKLPPELANPPSVDARHLDRANRSRRNLVRLALSLRRRTRGLPPDAGELNGKATELKAKIRAYDQRASQLEASEAELVAERQQLEQDKEAQRRHVQEVEAELADRLAQADKDVRAQWSDFQKRCASEEARLLKLENKSGTGSRHDSIQREREQLTQLKARFEADQAQARAEAERHQAALQSAEKGLQDKKAELTRMFSELKRIQDELRKQPRGADQKALQQENQLLREQITALEQRLAEAEQARPSSQDADDVAALRAENEALHELLQQRLLRSEEDTTNDAPNSADLQTENELLRQRLAEYEQHEAAPTGAAAALLALAEERGKFQEQELTKLHDEIARLQCEVQRAVEPSVPQPPREESDLENYEAELNRYRQQLEADRGKLNKEIESLRARNAELDEATRELEMEMSRERAEMARERTRLDRLRDEVKAEMERIQREGGVRESLASVQRLRDEMKVTGSRH